MGAYNGRLLPRSVFGMPLQAVVLSSMGFCSLVLLLSVQSIPLRLVFLAAFVMLLARANRILRAGPLVVILRALRTEHKLKRRNQWGHPLR